MEGLEKLIQLVDLEISFLEPADLKDEGEKEAVFCNLNKRQAISFEFEIKHGKCMPDPVLQSQWKPFQNAKWKIG